MADSITVNGTIATDPRHVVTSEGYDVVSFRLASSQRYFDRKRSAFVEGDPKVQITLHAVGAAGSWQ